MCQVLDQLKEDVDKFRKKQIKQQLSSSSTNHHHHTLDLNESVQIQQQVPIVHEILSPQQALTINETEKNNQNINQILINPVVENFEFHVTHSIKCTQ